MHSDICGPFEVTSIGGAKYFLLLKDDYSYHRVVYYLKKKHEVSKKIEHYINLIEMQTGKKLVTLHKDIGLEFVNRKVGELLERTGIRHEKTCKLYARRNAIIEFW